MDRRVVLTALALTLGAALFAAPATSGPLDRQNTGPRVNPAADKMMRVPGVVGMRHQDAMMALQQAGLSAFVKEIRNYDKRHEGKEGLVISQMPLAGGVAMIGSSVTIVSYVPEQPAQAPPPAQPPAENYMPEPGAYDGGSTPRQEETPQRHDDGLMQTETDKGEGAQPSSSDGPGKARDKEPEDKDAGRKKSPPHLKPPPGVLKPGAVKKPGLKIGKDKGHKIPVQGGKEEDEKASAGDKPSIVKPPQALPQSGKPASKGATEDSGAKGRIVEKNPDNADDAVGKPKLKGIPKVKHKVPIVEKPQMKEETTARDMKPPVIGKPDTVEGR